MAQGIETVIACVIAFILALLTAGWSYFFCWLFKGRGGFEGTFRALSRLQKVL
jgi:hypothetical protein